MHYPLTKQRLPVNLNCKRGESGEEVVARKIYCKLKTSVSFGQGVFQAPSGAGTLCSAQDGGPRTWRNVRDGARQGRPDATG